MNRPDLNTCTAQEACDYAVYKIVKQGGMCMKKNGNCMYGNEVGEHCSIGWLLDHEDYELMTIDMSLYLLMQNKPEKLPDLVKQNLDLFRALQAFHDESYMHERELRKKDLDGFIITSAPQYQQWVDMGEKY